MLLVERHFHKLSSDAALVKPIFQKPHEVWTISGKSVCGNVLNELV